MGISPFRLTNDWTDSVFGGATHHDLVQGLIDGRVEPELFTTKLQKELNSSPQPCLAPFLKKSLPYLQQSLAMRELTIEGVNAPNASQVGKLLPESEEKESSSAGEADCNVLDRDDLEDEDGEEDALYGTSFHQTIKRDLKALVAEIRNKANVTVAEDQDIDLTVRELKITEVRLYGKFYIN